MARIKKSFTAWMREIGTTQNEFINLYNQNKVILKRGRPSRDNIYNQILERYNEELANNASDAWDQYMNSIDLKEQKSNTKKKTKNNDSPLEDNNLDVVVHKNNMDDDEDDEVYSDNLYDNISSEF